MATEENAVQSEHGAMTRFTRGMFLDVTPRTRLPSNEYSH